MKYKQVALCSSKEGYVKKRINFPLLYSGTIRLKVYCYDSSVMRNRPLYIFISGEMEIKKIVYWYAELYSLKRDTQIALIVAKKEREEKEVQRKRANQANELMQKLVEENKALQQRIAELELALKL